MRISTLSLLLCPTRLGCSAWEFPHPPEADIRNQKSLYFGANAGGEDNDVDIVSGSQFNGLRTYANLPYVNCLSDAESDGKGYDIAILGAPFDTVCCGLCLKSAKYFSSC
jgi:hypothetical protein